MGGIINCELWLIGNNIWKPFVRGPRVDLFTSIHKLFIYIWSPLMDYSSVIIYGIFLYLPQYIGTCDYLLVSLFIY